MSDTYQVVPFAPDGFLFRWPELGYEVELTRIHQTKTYATGEARFVTVNGGTKRIITETKLNLSNVKERPPLVKILNEKCANAEWPHILEVVCVIGLREHRKGSPPVILDCDGEAELVHTPFILSPLLYANLPTILYGPGDSGKSFLALYASMLLAAGGGGAGLAAPNSMPVMYLDWELSPQDMKRRMIALRQGHPELAGTTLIYRSMARPLIDATSDLTKHVRDTGIGAVVIDSLVPAAGGEPKDAETAAEFFSALKMLALPAIIIGHTPKDNPNYPTDDSTGGHRSIFGSAFFFNLARQVWEVRAIHQEHGGGDLKVGLYQRKNNMGQRHDALGFALSFTNGACLVSTYDLGDDEFLNPEGSAIGAIKAALSNSDNEPKTIIEIAMLTGLKRSAVEKALQRAEKRNEIEKFVDSDGGGRGKKATFWLPLK